MLQKDLQFATAADTKLWHTTQKLLVYNKLRTTG